MATEGQNNSEEPAKYEFNDDENKVIKDLAGSMGVVSIPCLFLGLAYMAVLALNWNALTLDRAMLGTAIAMGIGMIAFLAIAAWTRRSSLAFRKITNTSGDDVGHLMEALNNLRKMYSMLSSVIVLFSLLVLIGIALSIYWGQTGLS